MTGDNTGWKWWGGVDEEVCTYGPCDTKEEVIEEAVEDCMGEFQDGKIGFHVCEARKDPLRLADWLPDILEYAEESVSCSDRASGEYDEGPYFEYTKEQEADLNSRIAAACDEWQREHGLVFNTFTFSETRNHEHIVMDHPFNT